MAKKLIQVVYTVNDAALVNSAKTIASNEAAAKKADDAVKKFGKDATQAGADASKSFLNLGNVWKGLVAIGITAFMVNLGKKILDLGIKQEQLNIAFTTFLGSAEKAKKLLADLTKFSLVTPFTPDQVNNAAKALLAFGVRGEEIIPTLKMLGDVSAGTGKDLTEMAIIFGQIRSTGRLMGQDLLQLINAGFNPLQVISEKTGKGMKQLKEEMEKGLITFDMVADAFKTATSEGGLFFDLMDKQSQSVGGVLSAIEGNIDEILKNIFTATSGPVKEFVDQLLELTDAFLELSKSEDTKQFERYNNQIKLGTDGFIAYAKAFKDVNDARKAAESEIDTEIANLTKRNDAIYAGAAAADGEYTANIRKIESLNIEREAIKLYFEELEKGKEAERAKATAAELEKQAAALKKLNKERDERLKDLEEKFKDTKDPDEEEDVDILTLSQREALNELGRIGDERAAELKRQGDQQLQIQHDIDLQQIADEEAKQDQIKALKQQAFDFGLDLLGQFLMAQVDGNDDVFNKEKDNFDQRIKLAGDNERARKEIEAERDKFEQEQAVKAEAFADAQARKDKDRQIKQMIIQGVLNSLKALGNPPVPNFISAGITALFTDGNVGIARAVGFKEGGWIDGPGHETSDSIPIMASKNEFMVNAAAAKNAPNLLEAINERRIDDRILTKAQAKTFVKQDNSDIIKELQKQRKSDYYEEGYFVNEVIQKNEKLKVHTRAKYLS